MYGVFEKLLESSGKTIAEVSKETGIAKSNFSNWKSGVATPKADKLYAIAKYFNVPMEVFFADDSDKILADHYEKLKSRYANVELKGFSPLYDCAAGQGRVNGDYTDEFIVEENEPGEYSYCTIFGDSMYPVLCEGDVVKVHHQTFVSDKEIAIVKVDGETATAKYVEVADNGVWLRAVNKDVFEDRFYTVQEVLSLPITIIGKVTELRRKL